MEAYLQGSKAAAKIAYLRDLQDPTVGNESQLPRGPEQESSARIATSSAASVN
jgi:hypothetical protein